MQMTTSGREVARRLLCEAGLHKAPMSFYSQITRHYWCEWCKRLVELPSAPLDEAPRQQVPSDARSVRSAPLEDER